jgi:hypothetical protein
MITQQLNISLTSNSTFLTDLFSGLSLSVQADDRVVLFFTFYHSSHLNIRRSENYAIK